METSEIIDRLQHEWGDEKGFFWQLREGFFTQSGFERFKQIVNDVDFADAEVLDRHIVRLLWFIPLFMKWQEEQMKTHNTEEDFEKYLRATEWAQDHIADILGWP